MKIVILFTERRINEGQLAACLVKGSEFGMRVRLSGMVSKRELLIIVAATACAYTGLAVHGASMWINCGRYEDSVFVLGKDMAQAEINADIICPGGSRPWTRCAGKGWYAMMRAGTDGSVGYSCGFGNRQSALDAALRECQAHGAICNTGRSGFDPGLSHGASDGTATMGGMDEIYY